MTVSAVTFGNLALAKFGRDSIRTLDDNKASSNKVRDEWENSYLQFLEEFDWPNARVVEPGLLLSGVDTAGWTYAYQKPAAALVIRRVGEQLSNVHKPYAFGYSNDMTTQDEYIFSNESGAFIRYTSRLAPLTRMTNKQLDVASYCLAKRICRPLGASLLEWRRLDEAYTRELNALKTVYANMEPEVTDVDFVPELISVR